MKKYEEMMELLTEGHKDASKFFEKGNNAAATRTRKLMQQIKILAQEIRVDITDKRNG